MSDFFISLMLVIFMLILAISLFKWAKKAKMGGHNVGAWTLRLIAIFLCIPTVLGGIPATFDYLGHTSQTTKQHNKTENKKDDNDSDTSTDADTDTDTQSEENNDGLKPGDKIDKDQVESHGLYYSDGESNPETRYYINNDDKITAIKVIFRPDHRNTTSIQSYLSNILDDDDLKWGDDKKADNDMILEPGKQYNVWSSANEQWYHINSQKSDDGEKISQFTVWKGKIGEISE